MKHEPILVGTELPRSVSVADQCPRWLPIVLAASVCSYGALFLVLLF